MMQKQTTVSGNNQRRSSEAFGTSLAHLDLAAPFRLEHLGSSNAAGWIGVENGVDDIPTASLIIQSA